VFLIKNKAQAAMEFLMTYGWMILVVLIVIVALTYFGILSPDIFFPDRCSLPPGLSCLDFELGTSSATVVLQNTFGEDITISKVEILKKESVSCSDLEQKVLKSNEKLTLTLTGCDNGEVKEKFNGEISITYTKDGLFTHVTSGRMIARIEEGDDDNQTGGDGGDGGGTGGDENITCSIDSDCGTSGFVGDYYCVNDSITQNQTNSTCLNAGTVNSSCSVLNTSVALTYCDSALNEVCVAGNATCGMNETTGPTFEIIQITTDPGNQFVSVIYGDIIVWLDGRDTGWGIYMYDLSTGQETRVTTYYSANRNWPAIYGNIIAWEQGGNPDVYMYDISTGQETLVSTDKSQPSIYGDKIAYTDGIGIYVYDISTGLETQISTGGVGVWKTAIYGDKIVWSDRRNGDADIFMYDLSTGQETQITSGSGGQFGPDIYENIIVYTDDRTGGSNINNNIYMYDISTGQETQITIDPENIEDQGQPSIYGDIIAWESWENSAPYSVDIYMYDLSTGQITPVTTAPGNQEFADVYENKIVWSDFSKGFSNGDIYMAIIS